MRLTVDNFAEMVGIGDKGRAVVQLSRWREHVPFTVGLVLCGALVAGYQTSAPLDWNLLGVVLANVLAMSFAFMINDVADAPDDALTPKKRARNVISSGVLTQREGMLASWVTALIALALYAFGGGWTFFFGVVTLLLCYLYSAHPWRLKARPITDVLSHVLMLSGLLVMTGYYAYDATPGVAWYVIFAATLFSAYGQFYNQIDDYEVDKAAGLKNTVVLLGKKPTMALMYLSAIGAALCLGMAFWLGAFPSWLLVVMLGAIAVAIMFRWDTDMRGNMAEGSGQIQKPALLIFNLLMVLWVISETGLITLA